MAARLCGAKKVRGSACGLMKQQAGYLDSIAHECSEGLNPDLWAGVSHVH